MSAATIDLITRYYAAFNTGDMNTFISLLSDHVVHELNQGAKESGKHAFIRFMERMNRCYRERTTDLVVFANAAGTRAAAEYTVNGMYLTTDEGLPPAKGQTYTLPGGAFFTVANGKIERVTNYYNLRDWLAQVK